MAEASAGVHVWLPTGPLEYGPGVGHARLKVKTAEGNKYSITWLNTQGVSSRGMFPLGTGSMESSSPSGSPRPGSREAGKKVGFTDIKERTGQVALNPNRLRSGNTFGFKDDRQANPRRVPESPEMGMTEAVPNFNCELPHADLSFSGDDTTPFGVATSRIESYWQKLLTMPPGHVERRYAWPNPAQTCNGVVAEALLYGRLGLYATPPSNLIYQDARTLVEWVAKAQGRIDEMNNQYRKVSAQMRQPVSAVMPSYDEWYKVSEKGLPFYARRKEQAEAIDCYLRWYHDVKKLGKKALEQHLLLQILFQICDQLPRKPTSERREGMLWLARRTLATLRFNHNRKREQEGVTVTLSPLSPQASITADGEVLSFTKEEWSSSETVDTGLRFIRTVQTRPGRRAPATSVASGCWRTP